MSWSLNLSVIPSSSPPCALDEVAVRFAEWLVIVDLIVSFITYTMHVHRCTKQNIKREFIVTLTKLTEPCCDGLTSLCGLPMGIVNEIMGIH